MVETKVIKQDGKRYVAVFINGKEILPSKSENKQSGIEGVIL